MPKPEEPAATFNCPKCGSYKFGTSFQPAPTTTYCHGDDGCRFHFVDADRWRYFQLRGEAFADPAEYDAHLARWRDCQEEIAACEAQTNHTEKEDGNGE